MSHAERDAPGAMLGQVGAERDGSEGAGGQQHLLRNKGEF